MSFHQPNHETFFGDKRNILFTNSESHVLRQRTTKKFARHPPRGYRLYRVQVFRARKLRLIKLCLIVFAKRLTERPSVVLSGHASNEILDAFTSRCGHPLALQRACLIVWQRACSH